MDDLSATVSPTADADGTQSPTITTLLESTGDIPEYSMYIKKDSSLAADCRSKIENRRSLFLFFSLFSIQQCVKNKL